MVTDYPHNERDPNVRHDSKQANTQGEGKMLGIEPSPAEFESDHRKDDPSIDGGNAVTTPTAPTAAIAYITLAPFATGVGMIVITAGYQRASALVYLDSRVS